MCLCGWMGECHSMQEDSWRSRLSFQHMDSGAWTRVFWLVGKPLFLAEQSHWPCSCVFLWSLALFRFKLVIELFLMCVQDVCRSPYATVHVWSSEDSFVLFSHHEFSGWSSGCHTCVVVTLPTETSPWSLPLPSFFNAYQVPSLSLGWAWVPFPLETLSLGLYNLLTPEKQSSPSWGRGSSCQPPSLNRSF